MSSPTRKTSPLKVVAAWILVATPLSWGIYQSMVKSLPLFRTSARREPSPPHPPVTRPAARSLPS